jgi:hypothetical protein
MSREWELHLPFEDALRVKRAELWLEVNEPSEAINELQHVTARGWDVSLTAEVMMNAVQAARRQAGDQLDTV